MVCGHWKKKQKHEHTKVTTSITKLTTEKNDPRDKSDSEKGPHSFSLSPFHWLIEMQPQRIKTNTQNN